MSSTSKTTAGFLPFLAFTFWHWVLIFAAFSFVLVFISLTNADLLRLATPSSAL